MASSESLQRAAQAWRREETEGIELDTRLAVAFAEILDEEKEKWRIEFGRRPRYVREVSGWDMV